MSKKSTQAAGQRKSSRIVPKKSTLTPEELKREAEFADMVWRERKKMNKMAQEAIKRYAEEEASMRRTTSTMISIRIADTDLLDARILGARKGIGYQTLLKMLVHEGLRREARRK